MPTLMMECGHAANGKIEDTGQPVCVICFGLNDDAELIGLPQPDLDGRMARCSYYGGKCTSEQPSSTNLAFFSHSPDETYDRYYCGCYGWD